VFRYEKNQVKSFDQMFQS